MADHCPTCGALVKVVGSDEGTHHYEPVVDEAMARVRDRLSEILDEVEDTFGKPFRPGHRENLTAAIIETMAEQAVALSARVQAYEAVVEAARALRHGTAEIQAEARDRMDRALDALPGEGER